MNRLHLILASCLFGISAFGQQTDDKGRIIYLELNERADFFEVNPRYDVNKDSVFFSSPGFLVYPDYDTIIVKGTTYVILRYPPFKNGNQQISDTFSMVEELLSPPLNPYHISIQDKNDKLLLLSKEEFDQIEKLELRSRKQWGISSGLLTVPFKLRPKVDSTEFTMSTDVSLGPYIGLRKRLSRRRDFFITVPLNLGLSYININENTTSTSASDSEIGVVPGVSWSTGLVFELNQINIGIIAGTDYASDVGKDWLYQDRWWFSFAIGYNFLNPNN